MMDDYAADVRASIVGLPASGKTTFLAALWHLVQAGEISTKLRFGSLSKDDHAYLNVITKQWRSAREQERTEINGIKSVSMNLIDAADKTIRVTFPDVPGEQYQRIWEDRLVDETLAETLSSGNIMLFFNGDSIRSPDWVTDRAALGQAIGDPLPEVDPVDWHPRHAPTQVQLVDLLQHLRRPPLDAGPRRLAVMISAWDKAEGELLRPGPFLRSKMPLLDQYLRSGRDAWTWRVYGVSAQDGEYDQNGPSPKSGKDATHLRDMDIASKRIRLVSGDSESHDLTEPLEWLMT